MKIANPSSSLKLAILSSTILLSFLSSLVSTKSISKNYTNFGSSKDNSSSGSNSHSSSNISLDSDSLGNLSRSSPPNSNEYILSPDFEITNQPRKRVYKLIVKNTTAALDGFLKPVLSINDQIPGPLIEANEGDQMEITVVNRMSLGLTIHWHGIFQNGTNWEDGVTGITQCPIPPDGGQYTYKFNITGQFGTFWYHAHQQNFMADGISGPFIVHSVRDPLKRSIDYDQDAVLFLTDWYHNTSETIVSNMLTEQGYFGTPAAPGANSALINGIGQWNCSFATESEQCQQIKSPIRFNFVAGERIRFRLINAGSHSMFYYSVDEHTLNVTEADATGVHGPSDLHRVKFHNGQRYSVVIKTKKEDVGKSFYMRANMDSDCWSWVPNDAQLTALGIINLLDSSERNSSSANLDDVFPNTKDWKDQLGGECADLDSSLLRPILQSRVPAQVSGSGTLANAFGYQIIANGGLITRSQAVALAANNSANAPSRNLTKPPQLAKRQVEVNGESKDIPNGNRLKPLGITVDTGGSPPPTPVGTIGKFFVNNITWTTVPFQPILHDLIGSGIGRVNSTRVASVTFPTANWYDLIIVNLDGGLSHPYHLHAMDMHLVASGKGRPTPENLANLTYDIENPMRRDTIVIEGASFIVVRVLADIPGVWIMHCHIGWHLGGGFAGVVVVQPEKIRQFNIPRENLQLCESRVGPLDQIEPGLLMKKKVKRSITTESVGKLKVISNKNFRVGRET